MPLRLLNQRGGGAAGRAGLRASALGARIQPGAWIAAYLLQHVSPLFWRPRKELYFGTRPIAKPAELRVPTRHGAVRCLIYCPPATAAPPPVHVLIHGGGMFGRYPEQDDHVATYIAAETGAVVVSVDYDVTPQVQFPVAEEECYDVALWVHTNAAARGWDRQRISVGGESAGGKLAINVCQLAYAGGVFRPCALVAAYAVADVTRTDRTSAKRFAKISPALQRLVNDTYFAESSRRLDALASPLFDPQLALALPPTLILTGEYDTLAPEMDRLAQTLGAAGVPVVHRQFAQTDHGFTHAPPVATAREAIRLTGAHLAAAYAH
jgi:acetyl esterase